MVCFRCGEDLPFVLHLHMGHPDIIFHSSWTQGVTECFVMVIYLQKHLVLIDCDQGQELQLFFPGSFSFSLGVLATLGFLEENELVSETLKVIVIFFHRLLHRHHLRHILAGYDLVICLQFQHHRVLVNFQLNYSNLALQKQPDLVLTVNTSQTRSFYSQNSCQHFTATLQIYPQLRSFLHKPVDSPFEPLIDLL